jgi:predicted GNAT family acetyltransferase
MKERFNLAPQQDNTMISDMNAHLVIHHPKDSRFEIKIDNHVALLEYKITDKSINIYHTFVPTELRGKGLAAKLAQAALEYAKTAHLEVIPQCSYIETYMKRTHFQ